MPSRTELVAHNRTTAEVATAIGADLVIFQTLPDLVKSVQQFNPKIPTFDCSVFTGEYVTGGVDAAYLNHIESLRSDDVKTKTNSNGLGALVQAPKEEKPLVNTNGTATPPQNGNDTIGLHNSWNQ